MRDAILAGARSLALMLAAAASICGTVRAQGTDPVPPPPSFVACATITSTSDVQVLPSGPMRCRCGGLFGSSEVEIGPVVVTPGGTNGGVLPNCYAAVSTTPAHNATSPGGLQNFNVLHLPVTTEYYACDRSGCYWFHGTARCLLTNVRVTGYVPYHAHEGACVQG